MSGLLAYGSLMHPDEIATHCAAIRSVPVRVRGFRRSFSQEPSWRTGEGTERGVLTVRPSAEDWLNAILIIGADAAALRSLDHRERGYTRVNVQPSNVEPYESAERVASIRDIALYTGRADKRNDALRPNRPYVTLCMEAAARWGEEFVSDFLRTTYVGDETLEVFLHSS